MTASAADWSESSGRINRIRYSRLQFSTNIMRASEKIERSRRKSPSKSFVFTFTNREKKSLVYLKSPLTGRLSTSVTPADSNCTSSSLIFHLAADDRYLHSQILDPLRLDFERIFRQDCEVRQLADFQGAFVVFFEAHVRSGGCVHGESFGDGDSFLGHPHVAPAHFP